MRWRLRLAEYDFTVMYKKGALNTQADALSRLCTDGETVHEDWDDIPALLLNERGKPRKTPRHFMSRASVSSASDTGDEDVDDILDISDVESD